MRLERSKNAIRGTIVGIVLRIYQILLPFILRTVLIRELGIGYLGLNSLFTSVLQVLNLAELGVGGAMVFSMYKPIAENDTNKICLLLKLYKIYYRIIGTIIAVVGIFLIPFLRYFIAGEIPVDINIYVIYGLNLCATVATYWLYAYKNSLLTAFQRNDITYLITIVLDTFKYVAQLFSLIVLKNYYAYLVSIIVFQILSNIVTAIIVTKLFPQYRPKSGLAKQEISSINHRIKDLFTAKLGGVIVGPLNTIIVSAFLGLSALAIYQNYMFVITSITGMLAIIYQACMAGIGNSIELESTDKNYTNFENFTFVIMWIIGWCTCCFFCLFQPFMFIWMGSDLMLSKSMVLLFCIYFIIYEINQIYIAYKDAAGIWHSDRYRPLIVSLLNLLLNFLLINRIGIAGVLLSTIVSTLFVGFPWLIVNIFRSLFHCSSKSYLIRTLKYVTTIFIVTFTTQLLINMFNFSKPWIELIGSGIVCLILPNILFAIFYFKTNEFKYMIRLIKYITHIK